MIKDSAIKKAATNVLHEHMEERILEEVEKLQPLIDKKISEIILSVFDDEKVINNIKKTAKEQLEEYIMENGLEEYMTTTQRKQYSQKIVDAVMGK